MYSTRNRPLILRGAVAALAVSGALLLGACGSSDTVGPETGADVADLQSDPDAGAFDDFAAVGQFVGQNVTVSAKVSEVLGPNGFTIADQSGETVLVIYDGSPSGLTVGSPIKVTGLVAQTFAIGEAGQFAGADLDPGLYGDFNTDPYIQASSVQANTSFQTQTNGG